MILLIRGSQSCQIHRDKKQNGGCQGAGGGRMGTEYQCSEMERVLEIGYTTMYQIPLIRTLK